MSNYIQLSKKNKYTIYGVSGSRHVSGKISIVLELSQIPQLDPDKSFKQLPDVI